MSGLNLPLTAMDRVLPMHVIVDAAGRVIAAGPTARKLLPQDDADLGKLLSVQRPVKDMDLPQALAKVAKSGDRLVLRSFAEPVLTLRAQVAPLPAGQYLVNLGFGIHLGDAVAQLGLTANDFAATDLAMELLFLFEANRGVMHELSVFNRRLEAARDHAEAQAHTDVLTGLQNRRGLQLALDAAIASTRGATDPRADGGFAIVQLDLDRFKQINDHLGHAAGDEMLRHVAKVLRREIRSEDCAARIGGDEFVLLLRGFVDQPALERLGRRIISVIEQPVTIEDHVCRVSASVGVVTSRCYAQPDANQMLGDADAALYRSKHAGRGRVSFHDRP